MFSSRNLCSWMSVTPRSREPGTEPLHELLGGGRARGDADDRHVVLDPGLVDLGLVVDQVGRHSAGPGRLDEPVRVRRVARADHEQQVDLLEQLLHGPLPVRGRVTDVLALRSADPREPLAEGGDHDAGLVDREGRLGDVGELGVRRKVEGRDLLLRLDEDDRVRNLAHRADDLLVPGVADEDDGVALGGVALGLHVHLGHERAGRVDRPEAAGLGVRVHGRCDAVGREHHRLPLRHLGLLVDEDRAALLEVADDVDVVDDLLADVDRRPVEVERALHGLDRPLDARAIASRRSEENFLDHLQGV